MITSWTDVADLAGAFLLLLGGALCLAAALGVLRFPDMVTRMHAGAKPGSVGLVLVVTGLALSVRHPATLGLLALVVALQVLTVPVSAHMVARTAYRADLVDPATLVVDELAGDLTVAGYGRGDDDGTAEDRVVETDRTGARTDAGPSDQRDTRNVQP